MTSCWQNKNSLFKRFIRSSLAGYRPPTNEGLDFLLNLLNKLLGYSIRFFVGGLAFIISRCQPKNSKSNIVIINRISNQSCCFCACCLKKFSSSCSSASVIGGNCLISSSVRCSFRCAFNSS